MKIQSAIITVIVISLIFIGATAFIDDLGSNYEKTADYSNINITEKVMKQQINKTKEINDIVAGISLDVEEGNLLDVPYKMIKGGWQATLLFFGSFGVVYSLILNIGAILGLPFEVASTIVAIITIGFVVMLLYLFFKWRIEN